MSELTTDAWEEPLVSDPSGMNRRPSRRAPVTDLNIWLDCYGRLAALLSTRFPEKAPEFWAYQSTIVRAARNYEGATWVAYDRQYRREALANKNLNWSVPNPRLYSEAFTGRARSIPRCQVCLSDTHAAQQCPSNPNPFAAFGWGLDTRQMAPSVQWPVRTPTASRTQNPVCRNYNENRCSYPKCRYVHQCLECGYPHPYVHCPRNPASQAFRPGNRSRSPIRQARQPPRPLPQSGFPQ